MAPAIELSIPTTSLSTSSKPYTLYNISIKLPLRSYIVPKRYSDFVELHSSLTAQASSPPPASLPRKSWFQRTASNPALTEERRKELEKYVQAIKDDGDTRWRDTTAWRAFLNLPSSLEVVNSGSSKAPKGVSHPGPGGRSPITDSAVWLEYYRDLKTQLHDARLHLTRRDQASNAQAQHESSAAAKRCLVLASTSILALDEGLKSQSNASSGSWGGQSLGDGELRRRKDLISNARREKDGLESLANTFTLRNSSSAPSTSSSGGGSVDQNKTALLNGAGARSTAATRGKGGRVLGGIIPETERTREVDNEGVLQLQKDMMDEQDESVEQLRKVIARQKELGVAINNELEEQNAMLRLVDEDVDRVEAKVKTAKKKTSKIS